MDPVALVSLCVLLLHHAPNASGPNVPLDCPSETRPLNHRVSMTRHTGLVGDIAPADRDAIARVAFAEAGNQGDSGLAAVIYTILNRLKDGRWGGSIDAVLNAHGQFEPVLRAGGDWRRLSRPSAAQQARVDTILNLALEGRLPDLTEGARYFQNSAIVAARARAGQVSPDLVNFGGQRPSVIIGGHSFYTGASPNPSGQGRAVAIQPSPVFVGSRPAPMGPISSNPDPTTSDTSNLEPRSDALSPGAEGIFVGASGRAP